VANSTIAIVPPDITNEQSLRLFLVNLVENLDTVLGYRGSDTQYASAASLATEAQTLNELAQETSTTLAGLAESFAEYQGIMTDTLVEVGDRLELIEGAYVAKGWFGAVNGGTLAGSLQLLNSYNIFQCVRQGIGLYNFTLNQTDIGGRNVLEHSIPLGLARDSNTVCNTNVAIGSNSFTVEVRNSGGTLIDPDGVVMCVGLLDLLGDVPS